MKGYIGSGRKRTQPRTFKNKEYSVKNSDLMFGHHGIKILSKGILLVKELIPLKRYLMRIFKGIAKVWTRFLPEKVITKKPDEARMGKGKGKFEAWVAPVKAGMILFEISRCDFTKEQKNQLKIVRRKLSVKTKFINKF